MASRLDTLLRIHIIQDGRGVDYTALPALIL